MNEMPSARETEQIRAIEENLNPLLCFLKHSPIGVSKLNMKHVSATEIVTFVIRLVCILLFFSTCIIYAIAILNARKMLESFIRTERIVQTMILLYSSIGIINFINLICATMWFWNKSMDKFCAVLSRVCELSH
jgi:hypothetical protein